MIRVGSLGRPAPSVMTLVWYRGAAESLKTRNVTRLAGRDGTDPTNTPDESMIASYVPRESTAITWTPSSEPPSAGMRRPPKT
jgi:hypothetical protein